jgi:hypothetical protein
MVAGGDAGGIKGGPGRAYREAGLPIAHWSLPPFREVPRAETDVRRDRQSYREDRGLFQPVRPAVMA